MKVLGPLFLSAFLLLPSDFLVAGSATWQSNPTSDDWNTAANWVPQTVPNGPSDIATFGVSEGTLPLFSDETELAGLIFNSGAGTYKITSSDGYGLTISGFGITNNSGLTQHFIASGGDISSQPRGFFIFTNNATAGSDSHFTAEPGRAEDFGEGGVIKFLDQASADHGFFEVFGSYPEAADSGQILFYDDSTAADATFVVHAGIQGGYTGDLTFFGNATAANATIKNKGGFVYFWDSAKAGNCAVANDGYMVFRDTAGADHAIIDNNTAGDASYYFGSVNFWMTATSGESTIINEGGAFPGALGGQTIFTDDASAGNATIIANPGVNGGAGGLILFTRRSVGATARVEIFDGVLDITEHEAPGITVGSLEGDGLVIDRNKDLTRSEPVLSDGEGTQVGLVVD